MQNKEIQSTIQPDTMKGNFYDEHFEQVHKARKSEAELRRSQSRYTPQPWHIRNRPLFLFAVILSIVCHVITIGASASNVFTFIYNIISGLFVAVILSAIITGAFLIGIEWLKRYTLTSLFKDYHDPNNYSMEKVFQAGRVIFLSIIFISDMALAWNGSWEFVEIVQERPVYQPPTLSDREQLIATYLPQVTAANEAAIEFKKSRTYLNKLSIADANKYKSMREDAVKLQSEMNAALIRLEENNAALLAEAKGSFDTEIFEHETKVNRQGHWLAYVSLSSFALLVLCVWYIEKYHYRLWFYNEHHRPQNVPADRSHTAKMVDFFLDLISGKTVITDFTGHNGDLRGISDNEAESRVKLVIVAVQAEIKNYDLENNNPNGKRATIYKRIWPKYDLMKRLVPLVKLSPTQVEAIAKIEMEMKAISKHFQERAA